MFSKSILFLFLCVSCIDGSPKFRNDYSFSRDIDGWLKLHLVPAIWSDARLICHAEGAVLASPLSWDMKKAILRIVSDSAHTIYTGVHTTFAKGVYASVEGVPLEMMPITWAIGEPDNLYNSESCLVMQIATNGSLRDVKCNAVFPFVCYKKKTQSLVFNSCETHDTGYEFESRTGSCYKFHRSGLNWHEAYRTCMGEGGHLVIINSDVESQVLNELYNRNPASTIFAKFPQYASIGTFDANDGGYWMTIHGQTPREAGFDKWQTGEPNNGTQPRGEFCGVTQRSHLFLHDAPCDWIMPFICEKKPKGFDEHSTESNN